jgi:7tm Odorant receptor.
MKLCFLLILAGWRWRFELLTFARLPARLIFLRKEEKLTLPLLLRVSATGLISNTSAFSIHIRGQYTMLALQLERSTSASHLHDIIQKHQHLLHFRDKLAAVLANTCLLKAFIYNLTMTLSLYQLSSVKTVNQRAFQLIFQYVVILIMFYSFTTSSEVIDEGNELIDEDKATHYQVDLTGGPVQAYLSGLPD